MAKCLGTERRNSAVPAISLTLSLSFLSFFLASGCAITGANVQPSRIAATPQAIRRIALVFIGACPQKVLWSMLCFTPWKVGNARGKWKSLFSGGLHHELN